MKKTARAHTNIALIKYWGKSNQALKPPLMSSLSMTLDAFYTDTTFEHDSSLTEDTFILNGQKQHNLLKDISFLLFHQYQYLHLNLPP